MDNKKAVIYNINGGQVNIANGYSTINANQSNEIANNELENIVRQIMMNLSKIDNVDAQQITDVIEIVKEEITKPEPKASRLRNCIAILAPLISITNGIPILAENLQAFANFIASYIH